VIGIGVEDRNQPAGVGLFADIFRIRLNQVFQFRPAGINILLLPYAGYQFLNML
jgi:hypothetical protein